MDKFLSYKNQILLLIFWGVVVVVLFKLVPDRKVAALMAGLGFLIIPSLILFFEFRNGKNKVHIFAILLFLICSAYPIFIIRIFYWSADFQTLNVFGVQLAQLHKASGYLYILMITSAVICYIKNRLSNVNIK